MSEAWPAGPHRSPEPLLGDPCGRPYIFIRQIRSAGPHHPPDGDRKGRFGWATARVAPTFLAPDEPKQAADARGRFVAGDLASL